MEARVAGAVSIRAEGESPVRHEGDAPVGGAELAAGGPDVADTHDPFGGRGAQPGGRVPQHQAEASWVRRR
jgi:hypothetical protein